MKPVHTKRSPIIATMALPVILAWPAQGLKAYFTDTYGFNAAAMGKAGGEISIVRDYSSVYYNPAGLGRANAFVPVKKKNIMPSFFKKDQASPGASEGPDGSPGDIPEGEPGKIRLTRKGQGPPPGGAPTLPGNPNPTGPPEATAASVAVSPYARAGRRNFSQISLGYLGTISTLESSYKPENIRSPAVEDTTDQFFLTGLVLDMNAIYDLDHTLKVGLGAAIPGNGNLVQLDAVNPRVHKYLKYGRANRRFGVGLGMGLEVIKDTLYAGMGGQLGVGGQGKVLIRDIDISPNPENSDQQFKMEVNPAIGFNYGLQWDMTKNFSVGFSYAGATKFEFDPVEATAVLDLLSAQVAMEAAILDFYTPARYNYGVAYRFSKNWLASIDLTRVKWSGFEFAPHIDKKSEGIQLINTTESKFSLTYKWTRRLNVYGGIGSRPSPVASRSGTHNIMDGDTMITAMGLTYSLFPFLRLRYPLIVDIGGQIHHMDQVDVKKKNPSDANPNYNFGGKSFAAAITVTNQF